MAPVLELRSIGFRRDGRMILDGVDLTVEIGERWLILGANGSGKTSLLRIAALYEHPTQGDVEVLGERLGEVDVRVLRRRIGYVSAAFSAQLRRDIAAVDVVKTARHAALEPWWHTYDEVDLELAMGQLAILGVAHLAPRAFGTLSSGEQQRVLLARALMNDPAVLLLDEPAAGLDLAGREGLLAALEELAARPQTPPFVLVTHHLEEIPTSMTHVLLLREGRMLAAGPIATTLTAETVSHCFGLEISIERRPDGRFSAWARSTPVRGVDGSPI